MVIQTQSTATETESQTATPLPTPEPRALVDNLLQLIEQARGELDIRKLYERPAQP